MDAVEEQELAALCETLRTDVHRHREESFRALAARVTPENVPWFVARFAAEPDPAQRGWLLELIARIDDAVALRAIVEALHDADPYVRRMALGLLVDRDPPELEGILEMASLYRFETAAETNAFQAELRRAGRTLLVRRRGSTRPVFVEGGRARLYIRPAEE